MIKYNTNGLKLSYPKILTHRGDFPYLTINSPKSGSSLSIILLNKQTTYENEFKIKLDPANIWDWHPTEDQRQANIKNVVDTLCIDRDDYLKSLMNANEIAYSGEQTGAEPHELIRAGNYDQFPGAVERLSRPDFYKWEILIPINNRLIEIRAEIDVLLQGIDDEGNFIWMPPEDPLQFNPYEMENIWQPIINSLEFDQNIIDELPDLFEGMANSKKIDYSDDLVKMSYPEGCQYKRKVITNTVSDNSLNMEFFPADLMVMNTKVGGSCRYDMEYTEMVDPKSMHKRWKDPTVKREIIRSGDYSKFPAGKELLFRSISSEGSVSYMWILLFMIEDCAIKIEATSEDLPEMDYVWQPMVESMEFDHENVAKFSYNNQKIPQCNWEQFIEGQSQHFYFEFYYRSYFVGLYDANINLFTPDEIADAWEVTIDLTEKKWNKIDKRILLGVETVPCPNELPVDFYLNTKAPNANSNSPNWDRVIEGFIDCSSGKLIVSDNTNESCDRGPVLEIVLPKKGIYKFRVYYTGLDYMDINSDVEEHWQIYLWATDETIECNEIKVIKAFKPA